MNFVFIAIANNWSTEEENKLSFLVCVWKNLSEKFQAIKISYCLVSYCDSDVTTILNIWIFQSFLDSKVWSKWECWVEAVMDEPWKLADSALLTWMITGWREVRVRNFSKTVSSSGVLWKQNILFCEMKKGKKLQYEILKSSQIGLFGLQAVLDGHCGTARSIIMAKLSTATLKSHHFVNLTNSKHSQAVKMWTICWLLTNHSNHSQWIVGIMAEDCFESHLTNVLPFAFVASQRISNQAVKVRIRYINKLFENVHKTGREIVDVCLFLQDDEKALWLLWWWWWEEHKSWCVFIVFRSPPPRCLLHTYLIWGWERIFKHISWSSE